MKKNTIKILNNYLIEDLSTLVYNFIVYFYVVDEFTDEIIEDSKETGNFYKNKKGDSIISDISLQHREKSRDIINKILGHYDFLLPEYVQTLGSINFTELHTMCYLEMSDEIKNIKNLTIDHFKNICEEENYINEFHTLCCSNIAYDILSYLNKKVPLKAKDFQNYYLEEIEDEYKSFYMFETELYLLCSEGKTKSIMLVKDWRPKHFLNGIKYNQRTELGIACLDNHIDILSQLHERGNNKFWKPEHFQNKDGHGNTELMHLIKHNAGKFIVSIQGWKAEHFLNKNKLKDTIIHYLCYWNRNSILLLITDWEMDYFKIINDRKISPLYLLCKADKKLIIQHISKKWNLDENPYGCKNWDYVKKYMKKNNFI